MAKRLLAFSLKFDPSNLRAFLVGSGVSPSLFRKGMYASMVRISDKAHQYYSRISTWYFDNAARGGEEWAKLSSYTQDEREAKGFNREYPILVRTGSFRASVIGPKDGPKLRVSRQFARSVVVDTGHEAGSLIESDTLEVWRMATDPRFSKLHYGGKNEDNRTVPARPVIPKKERLGAFGGSNLNFHDDIIAGFADIGIKLDRT